MKLLGTKEHLYRCRLTDIKKDLIKWLKLLDLV